LCACIHGRILAGQALRAKRTQMHGQENRASPGALAVRVLEAAE
jgi:hypothetical protein